MELSDEREHAVMQDKATALIMNHSVEFSASSPEAQRVLQKIDLRIMPSVIIIYTIMLMVFDASLSHSILK